VTEYRYALVESDTIEIEKQNALLRELELPIAVLVHSGGKSLHAIVRIDAPDYTEYRKRVDFLYSICKKNGLVIDTQNRNPSRLSRMPGVDRNGNHQTLLGVNLGRKSWDDWMDFTEGEGDDLPDVVDWSAVMDNVPDPPEELIEGVLRFSFVMKPHELRLITVSGQ
jgi:RecA-family ATPase